MKMDYSPGHLPSCSHCNNLESNGTYMFCALISPKPNIDENGACDCFLDDLAVHEWDITEIDLEEH